MKKRAVKKIVENHDVIIEMLQSLIPSSTKCNNQKKETTCLTREVLSSNVYEI